MDKLTTFMKKNIINEKKKCEIATCKETKDLVIHHIKRKNAGGTNERKNLMVLCNKHHKMIHSREFR